MLLVALFVLCSVQSNANEGRWAARVQSGVWALAGSDPTLASTDDLQPFGRMVGDAQVVALGESYHTSGGFYRMKHRLFRYLVEEKGFRAFAIESRWQGAERANAYVQNGGGTARDAILQHINVWQSSEYADLVQWMHEWNRSHVAPEDQVVLFGFDIQQPWDDGPELIEFLALIGIPTSDPRSDGIRSCEAVVSSYPSGQIPPERHQTCLNALAAVQEHLAANRDHVVQRTSSQAFDIAMLRVVGLRAWENSVFLIAHDFAAGYNARDEGMAYAFHAVRAMKAPNAKTVVWAANSHVAQARLVTGEQPIGSYLAEAFGDGYMTFALTAYEAEIDFPGYPCGRTTRAAGSVEERLARYGQEALLVDTRSRVLPRGVLPMGLGEVRPHRDYDGIIYLEHSPKMQPYLWAPCK
jgi:erythromycin esterase-like protein